MKNTNLSPNFLYYTSKHTWKIEVPFLGKVPNLEVWVFLRHDIREEKGNIISPFVVKQN